MRLGPQRRLSITELMLLNCGAGENSRESLERKSTLDIGKTDAEAKTPIVWPPDAINAHSLEKTLMLGKIEGRRRKGGDRGLDGCMASPTQRT